MSLFPPRSLLFYLFIPDFLKCFKSHLSMKLNNSELCGLSTGEGTLTSRVPRTTHAAPGSPQRLCLTVKLGSPHCRPDRGQLAQTHPTKPCSAPPYGGYSPTALSPGTRTCTHSPSPEHNSAAPGGPPPPTDHCPETCFKHSYSHDSWPSCFHLVGRFTTLP